LFNNVKSSLQIVEILLVKVYINNIHPACCRFLYFCSEGTHWLGAVVVITSSHVSSSPDNQFGLKLSANHFFISKKYIIFAALKLSVSAYICIVTIILWLRSLAE
jgi:hypothetical protein